jgi:hypothetical protein
VVEQTIERTMTDTEGRYGPQGHTHRLTQVTTFRDDWIRTNGSWKLKARTQLAAARTAVDRARTQSALPSVPSETAAAGRVGSDSDSQPIDAPPQSEAGSRVFGVLPNYATVGAGQQSQPATRSQLVRIAALDSFDPFVYPFVGFVSFLAQLRDQEPSWGRGVSGYEKRYGTAFVDNTLGNMMTTAILPIALGQDPRYFVLGQGSAFHRVAYAASRSVVTRRHSGRRQFNLSEIGGNAAAAVAENAYHPQSDRTLSSTASRAGMQIMWDTLANELKEFWPDIRRRL